MQIVQGYLVRAYDSLAIGQDDNFVGYRLLAQKIYDDFQNKVSQWAGNKERVGLPPWETINRAVLNDLLDPQNGIPYAARAVLRTQLRMPPETTNSDSTFAIPTNTVAPPIGTNSVMTNSTSP
jgi:hypothetical protein